MPEYTREYLELAHKKSFINKEEFLSSDTCGCFCCQAVFLPNEVNEWIEEDVSHGETAQCPKCGIDSVIGSKSGFPVNDLGFLTTMRGRYF